MVAVTVFQQPAHGQAPVPSAPPRLETRLTIPQLARQADDIEFAAAECDVAARGDEMTCHFRQVFVTVVAFEPTACAITTNGYERTFRRVTPTRWVSAIGPADECGFVELSTLDDGGGTRWTMTIEQRIAGDGKQSSCRRSPEPPSVYSWRNQSRRLPCLTVQPGAIER